MQTDFAILTNMVNDLRSFERIGRVIRIQNASVTVAGLSQHARIGDPVAIHGSTNTRIEGEIVAIDRNTAAVMVYSAEISCGVGDPVNLLPRPTICPDSSWAGRTLNAFALSVDGQPLRQGPEEIDLRRAPPGAGQRRGLGRRLNTGYAVTDTFLPIARGQRVGVFAGSGVGKTSLLGGLARQVDADIVVLGLIGERGRELREFTEKVLGEEGMARSVVVASTSDQSPLLKRRAAWTATAIAEVFRDQGKHVLLIIDSLTRFAEAHREIALTAGEAPSLRAFPPSTANMIAALTERAGTGSGTMGDITAIYSVLVAGSDMEEPVADFARGVLDGHIVLDRSIAERGRFPAIDVGKSVSRSLPEVATAEENELLQHGRKVLNTYSEAETLVRTGLYSAGSDPMIDRATSIWPALDSFVSLAGLENCEKSFSRLADALELPRPIPENQPIENTGLNQESRLTTG